VVGLAAPLQIIPDILGWAGMRCGCRAPTSRSESAPVCIFVPSLPTHNTTFFPGIRSTCPYMWELRVCLSGVWKAFVRFLRVNSASMHCKLNCYWKCQAPTGQVERCPGPGSRVPRHEDRTPSVHCPAEPHRAGRNDQAPHNDSRAAAIQPPLYVLPLTSPRYIDLNPVVDRRTRPWLSQEPGRPASLVPSQSVPFFVSLRHVFISCSRPRCSWHCPHHYITSIKPQCYHAHLGCSEVSALENAARPVLCLSHTVVALQDHLRCSHPWHCLAAPLASFTRPRGLQRSVAFLRTQQLLFLCRANQGPSGLPSWVLASVDLVLL